MNTEKIINHVNRTLILGNTISTETKEKYIKEIQNKIHNDDIIRLNLSKKYMLPATIDIDYNQFGQLKTFTGYKPKTKILFNSMNLFKDWNST